MTIEEAVKLLEQVYKWSLDWDERDDGLDYCDAVHMAIAALRTIQRLAPAKLDRSRWEGCPNCRKWEVYGYRNYKPAYCRDCGKPLNEEAWAELGRRIGGNNETN